MNKKLLASFVVVTLSVLACGEKQAPPPPQQAPQNAVAPEGPTKVESVIGEAQVRKLSDSAWGGVKVGQKLGSAMELATKEESTVGLGLANGTKFTLGENSQVVIDSLLLDAAQQKAKVDVKSGTLAFHVEKLAQGNTDIQFNTRNMTAAVRGTEGDVGFDNGKEILQLREGMVAVRHHKTGKEVMVHANERLETDSTGVMTVKAWTPPAVPVVAPVADANNSTATNPSPAVQSNATVGVKASGQGQATQPRPVPNMPSKAVDTAKIKADLHQSLSQQDQKREQLEAEGAAKRRQLEADTRRQKEQAEADAARAKADADAKALKDKQAADARKQQERDAMSEARKKLNMESGSDLKRKMMEDAQRMKGN